MQFLNMVCMLHTIFCLATYLMMDKTKRKALRRCHQDLRTHIIVNDFLPSLHVDADGFLKDLESGRIRKYTGNMEQVDELIDILVTKENKDFDHFCVVLEKEGYHVWSEKLMEAAGLSKWQQLSGTAMLAALQISEYLRPDTHCTIVHDSLTQWQYPIL